MHKIKYDIKHPYISGLFCSFGIGINYNNKPNQSAL
jgi:hypothetical protein